MFFFYSNRFLPDVPLLLFISAFMLFFMRYLEKKEPFSLASLVLLSVAGFYMKFSFAFLPLAALLVVFIQRRRIFFPPAKTIVLAFCAALSLLPVFFYGFKAFRSPFGLFAIQLQYLAGGGPIFYYLGAIAFVFSGLTLVFVVFGLLHSIKSRSFAARMLLFFFLTFFVLLSFLPHKETRYAMPLLVFALPLAAFGIVSLAKFCMAIKKAGRRRLYFFLLSLFVALGLFLSFLGGVESVQFKADSFAELSDASKFVAGISGKSDVIAADAFVYPAVFSGRRVLPLSLAEKPDEAALVSGNVRFIIVSRILLPEQFDNALSSGGCETAYGHLLNCSKYFEPIKSFGENGPFYTIVFGSKRQVD